MAAGDPTSGPDLATGGFDGDGLIQEGYPSHNHGVVEITFGAGAVLTSGKQYAIIVRAPSAPGFDTAIWHVESPTGSYGGGNITQSGDSGATWSPSTRDAYFQTLATGVVKDSFTYSSGSSAWGASGTLWIGQTFTASSTYTITSVKLLMARYDGEKPGPITVSIRDVEGLPKPTNPDPADDETDVSRSKTPLSWDAPDQDPAADTYEIYFRESGDDWELMGEAQAGLSLSIPFRRLDYDTVYEWRVDATTDGNTITGDTWTFTCLKFDQIQVSYDLITGGSGNGPYDGGTQGVDWNWSGESNMIIIKRLVAASNNKIWYEDI